MNEVNYIEKQLNQLLNEERAIKLYIALEESKLKNIQKEIRILKGDFGTNWAAYSLDRIETANELLTTDEILQLIFVDRLNELKDMRNRKRYIASLSVALNKLEKSGRIIKIKVPKVKGLFYGLPQWKSESGELQAYYKTLVDNKIRN
jgi:hypothetical protein